MAPPGLPSAVQRYWSKPAAKKSDRSYLSRLRYGERLSSVFLDWNCGTSQGMISATSGGAPPATSEVSLSRKGWPDGTFICSILRPAYCFSNSAASFWFASSHGPGVDQYIHCSVVPGLTCALGARPPAPPRPMEQAVTAAPA